MEVPKTGREAIREQFEKALLYAEIDKILFDQPSPQAKVLAKLPIPAEYTGMIIRWISEGGDLDPKAQAWAEKFEPEFGVADYVLALGPTLLKLIFREIVGVVRADDVINLARIIVAVADIMCGDGLTSSSMFTKGDLRDMLLKEPHPLDPTAAAARRIAATIL